MVNKYQEEHRASLRIPLRVLPRLRRDVHLTPRVDILHTTGGRSGVQRGRCGRGGAIIARRWLIDNDGALENEKQNRMDTENSAEY